MTYLSKAKNKPIHSSIEYIIRVETANEYQEDMTIDMMYEVLNVVKSRIQKMHKKNVVRYSIKYTTETEKSKALKASKEKLSKLQRGDAINCKTKEERGRIIDLLWRSGFKWEMGDFYHPGDIDLRTSEGFCILPVAGGHSHLRSLLSDKYYTIHDSTEF